jgi:formylglycine-generating enzyme required for sulfatase activity
MPWPDRTRHALTVTLLSAGLLAGCKSPAAVSGDVRTSYTQTVPGSTAQFEMIWVQEGGFWIGRTEVTWDEYLTYCDFQENRTDGVDAVARPSKPLEVRAFDRHWGLGQRPAVGVSWNAARKYCQWLSAATGQRYRLPSETQWELACGSAPGVQLEEAAWYDGNSGGMTHEVGLKQANEHGLCDVLGNLWEYCSNPYDPGDPETPVLRGGSWKDPADVVTPQSRLRFDHDWTLDDPTFPPGMWWIPDGDHLGFRLLREPD